MSNSGFSDDLLDEIDTTPDEIFEILKGLVKQGGGQFHRDTAIKKLVKETKLNERGAAKLVNHYLPFDDRGMTYAANHDVLGVDSFSGDVSGLALSPGRVTDRKYNDLRVLKEAEGGHPLVPEENGYIERTLPEADATDVEVLCQALADPDFNPLLVGEAGTGKDTLIRHVCAETNRPVARINFGSNVRYEDLVGMYTLNEDGVMTWQDGYLTSAVRYGWTFVADEINAAPAESTMPLHQVTEERGKASLVIREKSEVVDPHPQFRFVATMNPPNSVYGGTNELNDAFKSRFYMIEIDYLDKEQEAELIDNKINDDTDVVPKSDIDTLCEIAQTLRSHLQQSHIETPYTTRELLKTCKLTETMSLRDATKTVFLGHASDRDKEMVRDIISQEL